MTKLDELVAVLDGKNVVIQTHNFPDPDAIGCAFGLQHLLKTRGISTRIVYFGKFDKVTFKLLTEQLGIEAINASDYEGSEDDYVINVDGQKFNANFTDLIGHEIACIDHHPWVTDYKYAFTDHRIVGACSTIITDYFTENNIPIPRDVATALLFGIKVDTQNFTTGVKEQDINAFAILNELADQAFLLRLESNDLSIDDLRAYGAAIQNLYADEGLGFVHIPFDCPDRLIAMVSSFILSLDCVDLSIVYADRNGGLKFSVRSELTDFKAGDLIHLALQGIGDGGGHPMMAGGVIFPDHMEDLGEAPDKVIRQRFLTVFKKLRGHD
ncbi:MAG: DHH family phosphoesterase [Clostridiales bacterium]|nr:DHH family phosphoesterase [Clostridiales bacterium]